MIRMFHIRSNGAILSFEKTPQGIRVYSSAHPSNPEGRLTRYATVEEAAAYYRSFLNSDDEFTEITGGQE